MLPSTVDRVPRQTASHVNAEIRKAMEQRVAHIAAQGPYAIQRRLKELDQEWDIERTLETNASLVTAVGAGLALLVHRRFSILPLVVGTFLFQHATQGWCPPLPVLRRLGFRTQTEIEQERYALKALRGDFEQIHEDAIDSEMTDIRPALVAVGG